MAYGGTTGMTLETALGRVVARTATAADLPWLNAMAEVSPDGRTSLPGWEADVRGGAATALADPDGTVWGLLVVSADMDGNVSIRWAIPARHGDRVAPTVVAVASELAGRGHSPVGVIAREDATALVDGLRRSGFEVDGETTRKGRVGLVATRWSMARAAEPERARTPSLEDATDDELVAEVHRRTTMAAAIVTQAVVKEELRLGDHGIPGDALDGATGVLFDMVRTGLAAEMEKAASTYVCRKWDEAGEHVLGRLREQAPKP